MASGRDSVADSLRGFAIILVVYAHVALWSDTSGITIPHAITISKWIYSFHMPFMFMISGYTQGMKPRGSYGFFNSLKKAVIDLYLPCMYLSFVLWLVMYFIVQQINPAKSGYVTLQDIWLTPFQGFNQYWFLMELFLIKIIHSIFEHSSFSRATHFLFWVGLFIAMYFCGGCLPLCVRRLSMGLYFHLGYIMRQEGYISQDKHPHMIWGIILFLTGAASFLVPDVLGSINFFTNTVSALFQSAGLFMIFYAGSINYSLLAVYGLYSMVVYCFHNWITSSLKMLFIVSGMLAATSSAVIFSLTLFAAMTVPILVVWLYKNVKCLRWIEYIFYPGKLILSK